MDNTCFPHRPFSFGNTMGDFTAWANQEYPRVMRVAQKMILTLEADLLSSFLPGLSLSEWTVRNRNTTGQSVPAVWSQRYRIKQPGQLFFKWTTRIQNYLLVGGSKDVLKAQGQEWLYSKLCHWSAAWSLASHLITLWLRSAISQTGLMSFHSTQRWGEAKFTNVWGKL